MTLSEKKRRLLLELEEHGNLHRACIAVPWSRTAVRHARRTDPAFARRVSELMGAAEGEGGDDGHLEGGSHDWMG